MECGIICIDKYELSFSLNSISTACDVRNMLVTCTSELVYENSGSEKGEAMFSFPFDGRSVVYEFEATIGGKKIQGVFRELEEAKNLYKAAKEKGQKAAIVQRNVQMHDVFSIKLGNFPPKSEARIRLKFAMELQPKSKSLSIGSDSEKFDLVLPMILRPRYTPEDSWNYDTDVYRVENKYQYSFTANLAGNKKIKNVTSANYKIQLTLNNTEATAAKADLESPYEGKHDLDLEIEYVSQKAPSVYYEPGNGGSIKNKESDQSEGSYFQPDVAMLNFVPRVSTNDNTGTDNNAKFEIVFIVDRSGSMSGSNITSARECLLVFLKSLPTNCKFQIYGFGSHFDKAFPLAHLYDKSSLATALRYQKSLSANFGGTDILSPMKDMFQTDVASDYTRLAFLLTDGDVGNQAQICDLIRQHSTTTRIFTVGIGEGVSTSLVDEVAQSGGGKSAFVRGQDNLSEKVVDLLELALDTRAFSDVKLEFESPNSAVKVVFVPSQPSQIFCGHYLTIFCMIRDATPGDVVTCRLSGQLGTQQRLEHILRIEVPANAPLDTEMRAHRLLAMYRVEALTREIRDLGESDDELKRKTELNAALVRLSLEANIVTDVTTFVAIDPDLPEPVVAMQDEYEEEDLRYRGCMVGMMMCLGLTPFATKRKMKSANKIFAKGRRSNAMLCEPDSDEDDVFDCDMDLASSNSGARPMLMEEEEEGEAEEIYDIYGAMEEEEGEAEEIYDVEKMVKCKEKNESSKNKSASSEDLVMVIVNAQKLQGFWKMDDAMLTILGINSKSIRAGKPGSVASNDAWMTAVLCQYLTLKQAEKSGTWRLIVRKANKWLLDNCGQSDKQKTVQSWMDKAATLL